MGTKYSTNSASGYNSTPPSDDGTVSESNKVKWSTIKTKLSDPTKDLADTINSELVTHFNNGPNAYTSNQTLGATNYNTINQVSGSSVTLTLTDASTLGAGWYCDIVNTDTSNTVSLARATASDMINETSADVTIQPLSHIRAIVNAAANGFLVTNASRLTKAYKTAEDRTFSGTLSMSGKSIIEANASIAAHATTMDPWSLGNYVTLTGSAVTFTALANAPQAGAEVEIYMNAAHTWTDGAVFEVDGDANWTAEAGDRVRLRAKSTTVFTVTPIKKTGAPVAAIPYIYIRDEKASGTGGGTFTNGAWRTRDLNTEVIDTGGFASLSSNQVTLAAGTYRFKASTPVSGIVNGHKCRLANITDTVYYYGSSSFSGTDNESVSSVSGRFTITASKVFELQHICETTNGSTNAMGRTTAAFSVVEVYSQIEFWKEA